MTKNRKAKKIKWTTVSLPDGLADDIQALIDESRYWPSLGSFAREACMEKLRKERQSPRKIVSEPILAFDQEEREK